MSAGYFVRTYEHWQLVTTQSDYGETITDWQKQGDIEGRAYKKSISGGFSSAQFYGELDWTFACHADETLANGDHIRFDGRQLKIQAVSVTSRGDRIEALCKEIQ